MKISDTNLYYIYCIIITSNSKYIIKETIHCKQITLMSLNVTQINSIKLRFSFEETSIRSHSSWCTSQGPPTPTDLVRRTQYFYVL